MTDQHMENGQWGGGVNVFGVQSNHGKWCRVFAVTIFSSSE